MNDASEERIVEVAAGQHGVVTRRQLLSVGLTSRPVEHRLGTGRLRRVHQGVYILGSLTGSLEPPLAALMAAQLACGPGALISHTHAAGLLDLLPAPPRSSPIPLPAAPSPRPPPAPAR